MSHPTAKTPLVLVHGWAGSSAVWRPVIEALPDDSPFGDIVAIDLPGSPLASGGRDATIPAAAALLVEVLNGLPAPALIVGHSMGAQVTLRAQELAPELICSEVVLDPAYGMPAADRDAMAEWLARIRDDGHGALEDFFGEALGTSVPDTSRRAVLDDFHRTPLSVIASYLESEYLAPDAIGLYPHTVTAARKRSRPVLSVYIRDASMPIARRLPAPEGSVDELWPGGSHFFPLEDSNRVADRLVAWALACEHCSEATGESPAGGP